MALGLKVDQRWHATKVVVDDLRPGGAVEFVAGGAEQVDEFAIGTPTHRGTAIHIVQNAKDAHHRSRQDRGVASLVVEAHVAACHRNAELQASVGEARNGSFELPHDGGIFRRTEVEAICHGQRNGTGRRYVAVRLGQSQLGTLVGVELGEPSVAVSGQCNPESGLSVDAYDTGVLGLREHGVALDVSVVLVGHEGLVREVRRCCQQQHRLPQLRAGTRTGQADRRVCLQRVLPVRSCERAVVDRTIVGDAARGHVDDFFATPLHGQSPGLGDLTDDNGLDVPLLADGHERIDVLGRDHRAHAFLRLAHQDFFRCQRGVAQRHSVEHDVHASVAVAGQFAGSTGDSSTAKILDAFYQASVQDLKGAFDQEFLHEWIADLNAGPLGGATLIEGLRREHADSADAVATSPGAVENDLVSDPAGIREVDILVPHRADAQSVDQRVAQVRRVEDDLTADVGQAQAVAVATDPRHHSGQHPSRVGRIARAESQRIHHRQRTGAH